MKAGQWVITADHISDPGAKAPSNSNAVGMRGPSGVTATADEIAGNALSRKFRIYDDDNELFYEGFCFLPDGFTEDAFHPLDDFGTPNAGAVRIDYLMESGNWEQL